MWTLVLSAIGAIAPKLVSTLSELWDKYGEKFMIYRKGAADQHRKDKINQLDRETDEARRAQERVSDIQKAATDRRGEPADGSDIFGSVRNNGEGGDWLKPKS